MLGPLREKRIGKGLKYHNHSSFFFTILNNLLPVSIRVYEMT